LRVVSPNTEITLTTGVIGVTYDIIVWRINYKEVIYNNGSCLRYSKTIFSKRKC
jgi:hypothetical protein